MASGTTGKTKLGRREIEFRLSERERFLRTLISNLPGVVFRNRADAFFTKEFISDGCLRLTGYRAEELTGEKAITTWGELMHPEDREHVFAKFRHLINEEQATGGRQFEIAYRLIDRDQIVKHVHERFRFVHIANGAIVALEGFATDITERTLADKRLRESESRYKLLAENMHDLVCLHDLNGKLLYVSPSATTLLGYEPNELTGASPCELLAPDDSELCEDTHRRLLKGETGIVVEYQIRAATGQYHWFETMAQTVLALNGKIVQLQTVSRDITKRKKAEAEREKAQEEFACLLVSEQSARRAAETARAETEHASRVKDEFLQMISHEFRTPLTTIKTFVRVLMHDAKNDQKRRRYLENISLECDRQIDMILNLLDVSRLEEGEVDLKREPFDVNRVLDSCEKIERPAAETRDQTFVIKQNPNLPFARGDEKAVRRALCTIIENAIKYTPENGSIRLTAESVKANHQKTVSANNFEMQWSEEIVISVADNGRGILPEDVPHVFQKFFRGKNPVPHDSTIDGTPDDAAGRAETPGVGLGLYLAKRLIDELGGRIEFVSEVGRGTTFTIHLPVWNQAKHTADTIDEYDFEPKGTEK